VISLASIALASGDASHRSYDHKIFSIEMSKISLSAFYDKMYMQDYNTCVPFGYKK